MAEGSPTHPADQHIAAPIRMILSDVDGVMTDGSLLYDSDGGEWKQFHVRDGLGVKMWLAGGGQFGIVSSRDSPIVERRAAELGVPLVLQGVDDKLAAVQQLTVGGQLRPQQIAYIGDDLLDLALMRYVGLSAAPADACWDVLQQAAWVLHAAGGRGAVRELIERLMRAQSTWRPDAAA